MYHLAMIVNLMNNPQSQISEKQQNLPEAVTARTKVAATIIDKIRQSQDIQTIFKVTTQELRQVLESDRSIVYQFNCDWSGQAGCLTHLLEQG